MSKENENSILGDYLKRLNNTPLLKKVEEVALVEKIEKSQNKIIASCVKYEFFVQEFLTLLDSIEKTPEGVISLSRKLKQDSNEDDILKIRYQLDQLESDLREGAEYSSIRTQALKIHFTGSIVNKLVTKIDKKYTKIQECDASLKRLLAYFECANVDELGELTTSIKSNLTAREYVAKKFMTTQGALMHRVHDYEQYKLQLKSLANLGVSLTNLKEIKDIYKLISKFEFEMKQYKNTLVESNLRLVVSRAKAHLNRGLELEDLIQEGNIGLMKAINKYDRSRGTKVGTYATWWIDQTIKRAISNKSRTVRIPTHIEFLQTTLQKVIKQLTGELGRPPILSEIAFRADVSEQELINLRQRAIYPIAIHEELGEGMKLEDVLADDPAYNPFEVTNTNILRDKVRAILGTLSPRSEKIIRLRFGIGEPHEEQTLDQIANQIGLTKMGVKLVQTKALKEVCKKGGFTKDK